MNHSELASLTLFRATPAQVHESRKRTWSHWGSILTEEQYLARNAQMDTMEWAANSRLITWVLAPRDDPKTLDFMCACKTYKRRGLVRYPGSTKLQEVAYYAPARVFTPPDKRGKGYASHMMRLLHWVISGKTSEHNLPQFPAEWGAPPLEVAEAGDGIFSILNSDVGENFYKQAGPGIEKAGGWEVRGSVSTVWTIPHEPGVHQAKADDEWSWLGYGDLDALWEKDVQLIRRTMESLPESSPEYHFERPKAFVSCLPVESVGSFHTFRSMYAAHSVVSMDVWGVEKKTSDVDQPAAAYATWCLSGNLRQLPPILIVTRMSATETEFPGLLRQIQAAARKSGIAKMEIPNIPKHLLKAATETGAQITEPTQNLPSIKWYGAGRKTEDVEWVFSEKYCWL